MKDVLDRFSFSDFAAYFFPGFFLLMGLFPLLLLTSAREDVLYLFNDLDLGKTVALLSLAYITGAISSGFSHFLMRVFYAPLGWFHKERNADPRDNVCPCCFAGEIQSAFNAILGLAPNAKVWSRDHFYLARLLVDQCMPRPALAARRQNSLRIFRENMIVPSLVWILAGLLWSRNIFQSADPAGGSLLLLVSIAALLIIPALLSYRSLRNREREVREIYLAVLAGHKLGLFEAGKKSVCDVVDL